MCYIHVCYFVYIQLNFILPTTIILLWLLIIIVSYSNSNSLNHISVCFQTDGLQGLGELDDVWSIRKNVTIGGNNNNKNISPRITNNIPTLASSPLTNNTGFYSRHAGGPPNNGGAKTGGQGISPTGSPREFPSRLHICKWSLKAISFFLWNECQFTLCK